MTFNQAGTIEPGGAGTVGTLTITGPVNFLGTSVVNIDWVSSGSYDILAISGAATLNGEIHTNFVNTAILTTYNPITWGSRSGTFATVTGGGLLGSLNLGSPTYNALNLLLTVII